MDRNGVIINGQTQKVIIGEEVVCNNYLLEESHDIGYDYGRLTRKIEIPGHTLCCVSVSGPSEIHREYLTSEYPHSHPELTMYNTITKCNPSMKTFNAIIGNSSEAPIILDKGTKVVEFKRHGWNFFTS